MKRNEGGHYSLLLFFSKTHLFLPVLWFGRLGPVQGPGSIRTIHGIGYVTSTILGYRKHGPQRELALFRPHPVIFETPTLDQHTARRVCLFVIPVAPARAVSIL